MEHIPTLTTYLEMFEPPTERFDHPAALPNYLRAGLRVYDRKMIQQPTS
jgi:hypothetical protein